jgi:hypothetical protein
MTEGVSVVSPYEANLLAGGTMSLSAEEQEGLGVSNPVALVWADAFSGRVPAGFQHPDLATVYLSRIPAGESVSQDFILASLTHPDPALRLMTAGSRRLTAKQLAVGLTFLDNADGFIGRQMVRMQQEQGMSASELSEAIRLLDTALEGDVDILDIIRGNF